MAYSSTTKPENHFNTILWTGDGSDDRNITGVGYQPDWTWIKCRGQAYHHYVFDSARGATKRIVTNTGDPESTQSNELQSFLTDGFQVGSDNGMNQNTETFVAWDWLAGGTAPAITYVVKGVSGSGNKYRFDDFGTSAVTLELQEGGTYTFDQSDSSNSGHPLRFYTASDKTGGEYTTGVTTTGTPGSSGAQTVITVAASAPTLYYQCSNHAGMGGQANTNSTHGSSNFAGATQTTISTNTTAGFSIVRWTGTGGATTLGHGLGATPKWWLIKNLDQTEDWRIYHNSLGNTKKLELNNTEASGADISYWNNTSPTSTVMTVGSSNANNGGSRAMIAYVFADIPGYSKAASYTGNGTGSGGGPFIYLGFKPAWFLLKEDGVDNYTLMDNRRLGYNKRNDHLFPNATTVEYASDRIEFRSNGVKIIDNDGSINQSGQTYVYMAFAENPFVANDSGTSIPTTGY